jgi:hypothetical protein
MSFSLPENRMFPYVQGVRNNNSNNKTHICAFHSRITPLYALHLLYKNKEKDKLYMLIIVVIVII